jgi:hypothetical protein
MRANISSSAEVASTRGTRCPACGGVDTQRVQMAWAAGTSRAKGRGVGVAFAEEGLIPIVSGSGTRTQTELA